MLLEHRDFLQDINARCAVPSVPGACACRLGVWVGQNVVRRGWSAPHHFPESLPKVLRQKRIQEWIQTRVEISQYVANDLNGHGERCRLIQL